MLQPPSPSQLNSSADSASRSAGPASPSGRPFLDGAYRWAACSDAKLMWSQACIAANHPSPAAAWALPHGRCESLSAMQNRTAQHSPNCCPACHVGCFKVVAAASAGAPRRKSATAIASYPLEAPRHASTSQCWTEMQQQRRQQRNRECPLEVASGALQAGLAAGRRHSIRLQLPAVGSLACPGLDICMNSPALQSTLLHIWLSQGSWMLQETCSALHAFAGCS